MNDCGYIMASMYGFSSISIKSIWYLYTSYLKTGAINMRVPDKPSVSERFRPGPINHSFHMVPSGPVARSLVCFCVFHCNPY